MKRAAPLDVELIAEALAEHAKVLVARETAGMLALIAELEKREAPTGQKGDPGIPGKDGANGLDGKDASECYAPAEIASLVAKSIAVLAESPEPRVESAVASPAPRLRTVFERNEKNQIVGARQEPED